MQLNVRLSRPDDGNLPASSTVYYGTAIGDSSEGLVSVAMDGEVVNNPDLEETTLVIPADDFKNGKYRLVPAPSEGSVSVYADGVLMSPEDWTIEDDSLVIPDLSNVLGVSVLYSTNVVQGVTASDISGSSVALVGVPSGPVTAVMRTPDSVETYPTFTVDGSTLTFDSIEVEDSSIAATYSRDNVITFTGDNLIEYTGPSDSILDVDDALWIAYLPDAPETIVFETIELSESVDPVYTESNDYVLDGSTLYITTAADEYQVSYSIDTVEEFMRSDLTNDMWVLSSIPTGAVDVTVDGEAFSGFTLDVQTLVFSFPEDGEWQITLTYEADVVFNGSTDDFTNGEMALAGDVVPNSATVYVDNAAVAFTVSENVLTVSSLIKDVSEYTVVYTGLREDNIVQLPTGPSVKAGETVTVQVVNGMPSVISSSGSGDRQESNIEEALTVAANAIDDAAVAQQLAGEAQRVAEATGQYFWADENGVHVTEVPQEEWNDPTDPNYHSGTNQLSNSAGILLRDGLVNSAQFTPGATAFYDGNGNEATNIVASFGSSGAQIGATDETHVSMDSDSFELIDNGVEMVHFGYGEGADSGGSLANAPYFTLGKRYGADDGVYSSSRTYDVGARVTYNGDSYICKVAVTTPEAWDSSKWVLLVGNYSLVAGNGGAAAGEGSLALGQGVAIGRNSVALGLGTTVTATGSVAVGKYNVEDTASDKLFIVGKGSNNVARSDAFTVDLYGNVVAAGSVTATDITIPASSTTTVNNVATAASGYTVSAVGWSQWGKIATMFVQVKNTNALSANTLYNPVATLVAGKHPLQYAPATLGTNANNYGNAQVNTNGNLAIRPSVTIAAGSTINIRSTFIVA